MWYIICLGVGVFVGFLCAALLGSGKTEDLYHHNYYLQSRINELEDIIDKVGEVYEGD